MKSICMAAMALMLFAALAMPASAYYSASLEVSSASQGICPCDIISGGTLGVSLRNLGTDTDTYRMSLLLPDGWTGFILPGLTLASGESGVVNPVWITPACNVAPGTYRITIAATSGSSGKRWEKAIELEVLRCHDVEVSTAGLVGTCVGEEAATEVRITNLGKLDETFALRAAPSWAELSEDRVRVNAGESATVRLTMSPPQDFSGIQNVTVTAQSLTSYAAGSRAFRLDVSRCYAVNATLSPAKNTVCAGTDAGYTLYIDNLGTKADTFTITGPSWITPGQSTIEVASRERKTVGITASPQGRGDIKMDVTVASLHHPAAASVASASLVAMDCRSVAVSISPSGKTVCRGESAQFVAKVENTGTVLTAFTIDSSSGTPEDRKLVLAPGETRNVVIDTGPAASAGTRVITVQAYDGDVSDEDSATLTVVNCYDASLAVIPHETSACAGDVMELKAEVKNTGEFRDDYTLAYLGHSDAFALEKGESREIAARLSADYQWETANKVLFSLRSSHGVVVEKEAVIAVPAKSACFSVDLWIVNGNRTREKNASTSVGQGVPVKLVVVNPGLRPDVFSITVDGPDWAYISADTVQLSPLGEESLFLYMSPPFGTEEKVYPITVIADSGRSVSGAEIRATVGRAAPNATGGNGTSGAGGPPTGFMISPLLVPLEFLSVALLAVAAAIVLLLRFAFLPKMGG